MPNQPMQNPPCIQRLKARLAPVLLVFLLGACEASAVDQRLYVQEPKRNDVFWVDYDHAAQFKPDAASLGRAEIERLDGFLQQIGASFQDSFVIDPGGDDILALRRAAALSSLIRTRLPTVRTAIRRSPDGPGNNQARLVVGRYVVVTPECGDWSKPSGTDIWNRPSSNFGCATTANLGLMVADPGDLIRGRQLTPGIGGRGVLGLDSYRAGQGKIPTSYDYVVQGQ